MNLIKIVSDKRKVEKIYLYVLPHELGQYNADVLTRRVGKEVLIFAVNDSDKYDPQGKAGKVKPGRPGIYIE